MLTDPTGMFGLGGMTVTLAMSINLHLPTLVEGSLIGLTLGTVGDLGGVIRRMGLMLLAEGHMDQGFKMYSIGVTVMSAAFFTAEVISSSLHIFLNLTALIGVARLALRAVPTIARIAGQSPRISWRVNPTSQVRTIDEAIDIARNHGVDIPDYVAIHVDDFGGLATNETARGPNISKLADGDVVWADFLNRDGKVPFIIDPELLKSDEAIVAVLAHEMHEIRNLKSIIQNNGGRMSFRHFVNEVMPGNPGNLHDQAWEIADAFVEAMRGGTP